MKNLIENDGRNPIEKLMIYRNDNTIDVDRRPEVINAYKELGMLTDRNVQEPDTFLASAYHVLRKLTRKMDKEFYEVNFRKYIEEMNINYELMSDNDAKIFRKKWFMIESTFEYYPLMSNEVVNNYVNATHVLGNFCIIPKAYNGWKKCKNHNEDALLYLVYIEENWNELRTCFDDVEFEEYIGMMFLEDLYIDGKICVNEYSIDYSKSFEEIYSVMGNIVNLIEKREIKMYKKLKERGTR